MARRPGANYVGFVILLLSGAGAGFIFKCLCLWLLGAACMYLRRRKMTKWSKVLLPRCCWVTGCRRTILHHRQRSANDEQRDYRETFHGGLFSPPCLSRIHHVNMRTPFDGRIRSSRRLHDRTGRQSDMSLCERIRPRLGIIEPCLPRLRGPRPRY